MLSTIQLEPRLSHLGKENTTNCKAEYKDSHTNMMLQHLGKKRALSCIGKRKNCIDKVKRERNVRFSELSDIDVVVGGNESTKLQYQLDQEGYCTSVNDLLWYTKRELAVFTKQARDHVLGFGHRSIDESTRGFERYDFARTQQKAMTRKIILLLMQQKAFSHEEKSLIARKSSAWAVDEAFVRGCMDFCEAYHPQMSHLLQHQHQNEEPIVDEIKSQLIISSIDIADNIVSSYQQQKKKRKLTNPDTSRKYRDIRSRAA